MQKDSGMSRKGVMRFFDNDMRETRKSQLGKLIWKIATRVSRRLRR
jgi:hypothetical protein